MAASPTRILLLESDPDIRELNQVLLEEAGYLVDTCPARADPVEYAEQTGPKAIVLGIRPGTNQDWDILDRLQANPRTQAIPVVVVSTLEHLAAEAKAAPAASSVVVAPFDIQAFDVAIADALKSPPASSVLPPGTNPVSPAVAFAADELARSTRKIVVRAIRALQSYEPYRSRFVALTPDLVDDLGPLLAAITQGMKRGLPPAEMFAAPTIAESLDHHVQLRQRQGIDAASTIREYESLAAQVADFLASLIGRDNFTARDAFDVVVEIQGYIAELVRQVIRRFALSRPINPNSGR